MSEKGKTVVQAKNVHKTKKMKSELMSRMRQYIDALKTKKFVLKHITCKLCLKFPSPSSLANQKILGSKVHVMHATGIISMNNHFECEKVPKYNKLKIKITNFVRNPHKIFLTLCSYECVFASADDELLIFVAQNASYAFVFFCGDFLQSLLQ